MGIAKKTDGRYVVGVGVDNANDYKGSAAYRDIYIQLTSSGATAKSEEYLTFLKDYAVNANASGEPIMPPSVNVWISNNGVTTAVEADDLSLDGNNYTICGIKWNGSTWDYSGAGQGKSGSGLPPYTSADKGKVLTIGGGEGEATVIIPLQEVPDVQVDESGASARIFDDELYDALHTLSAGDNVELKVNGNTYSNVVVEEIELPPMIGGTAISVSGSIDSVDGPFVKIEALKSPGTGEKFVGFTYTSASGLYPNTYTIYLAKINLVVTPKWENGVAIITIDSVTDAHNAADWAIYVNGVELTSEDDVADYLNSIGDRPMVVKYADGWSGAAHDRATVLYRKYSGVVFLDAADISLASYKIAGYTIDAIAD